MFNMKTASVREVQHHFGKVLACVEGGEEVQITRRSKLVARLVPSGTASQASVSLPDFAARARAIWGTRPKGRSLSKAILEGREERR
jgi:antitoxin (DNA-binding transcriptional repressor) of toxin-antitoxin stability system